MTKNDIRKAILDRLNAINDNCNKTHYTHNMGVVRGLLWVLNDTHYTHNMGVVRGLLWVLNDNDPGTMSQMGTASILKLAGIPYREVEDQVECSVPADWPKDE